MKYTLTLFIFTCFLFLTGSTYAQTATGQPHLQLSKGGYPWSFKFSEYDDELVFENLPVVDVATLMDEDLLLESSGVKSLRFGYDHYTSYKLNNSGSWINLDNGDKIWRLGLFCEGALSINLSFKSMNLPEGCRLFVYNEDKTQFHGAFTQEHITPDDLMLGTELLFTERVIVELYVPADAVNDVYLEIWRVTHGYRDLGNAVYRAFGDAGSCENNARCPAYAAWDNQIRSGICLVNGGEFCSAALINNTCNDGTPYVLTANHCGSSGFGSWVFRFNWEAPTCTTPGSSPSSNSISGGVQRAAYAGSDMSLLQMNSTPPSSYNVYYAGWDRNNTATTNAFGVHHPSGDIKKFSQSTGSCATATYGGATCWQTGIWTDGVTEPGSSGSPLFNNTGLIIGQLYGGPSDCTCEGSASCGYDYYGKVFTSWTGGGTNSTRLSNWLDPCSTGATTLLGYDPNAPTVALDAGISSITTPAAGSSSCQTTFTPVVVLRNYGSTTLTSCTINYHLDAAAPATYAWTGSLASGTTANITLPNFTTTAGAHTYTAYTSAPNAGTDGNTTNDSEANSFTVTTAPAGSALPFTEGFQAVAFPPTGWTVVNPDANTTWARTTAAGGFGTSTASARFDNFSPATSIAGQSDYLVTPSLDFSSTGSLNMTFDVAYARYSATYSDSLNVWITTNCGGSWTKIYAKGGTTLATAPDNTAAFTPTAAQWRTETISLNSYTGNSSVQLRFENKSGWGNYLYVDNVNLSYTTPVPVADFTASATTVCAGSTITFTNISTDATTYSWTFPGGTPGTSTATNPTITYSTPGTYNVTLVATGPGGSDTEIKTGYVVVSSQPTTSNAGIDQTVCAGTTVTMAGNTATSGTGTWTKISGPAGGTITTASSPTTTITGLIAGTYVYQWTISNPPCSASSDQMTITVNGAPTTANAGADQTICSTTTTVTMAGNTPTTGTGLWTKISGPAGGAITTASSPTTTITGLGVGVYTYQWTITNSPCAASSDQMTITVNAPPTTASAGTDQSICTSAGGVTMAANTATSGTGVWTQVSGPASTIATSGSPTTTVTGMTTVGTYVYQWTITNAPCTASNDQVTITVTPGPTTSVAGSDQTLCVTSTSVTMAGNTPSSGTGAWSQVSGPSSTITTASSPTTTITGLSGAGTYVYQWTISGAPCPASTDQVSIIINDIPTSANAGSDQTICSDVATVTLGGNTATVGTGTWTQVSGSASTITSPSSATSTITGLSAAGTYVYEWTIANAPCTASTDQVSITVEETPVANAGADVTICEGETVTLNGSGTGTYDWSPATNLSSTTVNNPDANPTSTVTYTLTVTNGGCTDADAVTVNVNPAPPVPTITNTSGTLNATPSSGYTYQWFLNGVAISGATASSYTPTVDGDYTVEITDGVSCSTLSDTLNVTGTGIIEVMNGEMSIYPNPNNGNFTITLNGTFSDKCDVQIRNGIGQMIYSSSVGVDSKSRSFNLNLPGIARGIYTLTVTDGEMIYSRKLIID